MASLLHVSDLLHGRFRYNDHPILFITNGGGRTDPCRDQLRRDLRDYPWHLHSQCHRAQDSMVVRLDVLRARGPATAANMQNFMSLQQHEAERAVETNLDAKGPRMLPRSPGWRLAEDAAAGDGNGSWLGRCKLCQLYLPVPKGVQMLCDRLVRISEHERLAARACTRLEASNLSEKRLDWSPGVRGQGWRKSRRQTTAGARENRQVAAICDRAGARPQAVWRRRRLHISTSKLTSRLLSCSIGLDSAHPHAPAPQQAAHKDSRSSIFRRCPE
ncbi:MAG: hypothetical protein Q9159_004915 [Coniocarpon cinnabarinum]